MVRFSLRLMDNYRALGVCWGHICIALLVYSIATKPDNPVDCSWWV